MSRRPPAFAAPLSVWCWPANNFCGDGSGPVRSVTRLRWQFTGRAGVPERPSAANRAALSRRESADYGDTLFNPFFSEGSSLAAPVPAARKSSVRGLSKASP